MATRSQWLLLTCLGFCTAWMDERPVLESRDGNLFISAAKDRNITLKILGDGYVNVNEINLLHVAATAQSATRLIERWRTGYLAEVESNLQRLSQIVEGPDGLEKRIAMVRGFGEGNSTLQPGTSSKNQTTQNVSIKMRMIAHRVRRVEEKVKSIESKLKINECTSNPCMNGGTCEDLYDGYQCHCTTNWEGANCVADVNECVRLLGTDLGCQNGATCFNTPGSYRCECAPGWYGIHCTKKTSVCNTQNSDELCGHGVCVAKPGSLLGYTCICDQGWQSDGTNPACIKDVDECAGNHRPCSVNPWVACRNAPGTFFCDSCPRGFTGNGYYCTDIDECQMDNGGCSTSPRVQCINTMGSRMCGPCPTGYRGDGVTCIYVGSCAINNGGCHPFATCVENPALTSAYVICRCPAGMAGDGIGPNGCQSSTEVSVNSPCSSNPCVHGRCVVVGNSHNCVCNPGYIGATCNDQINPCSSNPCKNNGVCLVSNGEISCDCPSTHTGIRCETPRQTCGGVSRNPIGHLQFPTGGNVYQHGLSCAWVLITNSSLVLNVTFTRFNLEQSTDCKYDFLQIHDGKNAGSQMIGRFCGTTFPNKNGSIVSSHNSLYFWFHSDNSISHDGFAFHWNSIEPVCGGSLTNDYGTISSPGSPGRYPPNRDCYWQINVRRSKRIQIHFGQLMLEEHPTCGADYLKISTIHGEQLGLYCNHTHPPPLVVPASSAVIYFHSDSAAQDAGFQIHYSVIEGIPGCHEVYTAPHGIINSPTNIGNLDIECEWKIQAPANERIEVSWSEFDLSVNKCDLENIELYDGDTSESPLLQRYCGNTLPPTIRSNSNVLLIIFKSKLLRKGVFRLSYNTLCGGIFTEESGIIKSPMYPKSYSDIRTCVYEIKQPSNKRIALTILDVDIRGVHTVDCYPNYFRVFDGPNENASLITNLCYGDAVTPTSSFTKYSSYNVLLLKYSMKPHTQGRGFLANYTTIESRCGGLLAEFSGTILSPSENGHYANEEDCLWTIQAPVGYVVQLTWLTFDLEQSSRCNHDFVTVYESYMAPKNEVVGTFCGMKKPPTLMTQGNTMTVVFHSDYSVTREGFVATYLFIDARKVCGGHFIKLTGVIQSPNYPKRYPSRKECVWVIEAPNKQRVVLNVNSFELESHSTCGFDYLEIRNGGFATSPLIGKFCGTEIPHEIISQTNQLYLKFVTDLTRAYTGFNIEWDSTTIGCGGTLNGANGDIMSPNYPQPYMQQAECYWKIAVAEGSLVRLLIVDLQLEHHDKCRFDFIEISEGIGHRNSQRYCTSPYPKIIQTKSNIVNIRFRSDYTNSDRGFHLKYETLCEGKTHRRYGVIESPNFPNKYEHNLNCSWIIDAPIGNKINLTFSHFDLEGTGREDTCKYDYLEVQEGSNDTPDNLLGKFCNSDRLPPKIHSSEHQVFVKFVTDSMLAFNGFRLEWVFDGCGGHLTRPFGAFTSPGYPSAYPQNIVCEWLIEVDHAHSIELTIHDINTERMKGCLSDRLQIFTDVSEAKPMVEVCYSTKPLVYTSFGNTMFLIFLSDSSYSARGFNASYKSVPITCGGKYTTDSGIILSKNYPQNYPNKQNCEWLMQVDPNYVINLVFLEFDLENSANCTDDFVEIYDGPTKDSPLLGHHCRNQLPPSYVSTSNEMLVVMRTDSIISAKGFKAVYQKACGARIVVKDQGYITADETYINSLTVESNCSWILVAEDPADHVTVTFTHMKLGTDFNIWDDCSWNYVEVFDGEGLDGPSRGKWCSRTVPLPITSNGNALTVHMNSNYDFTGHFSLTYSVLNSACGGTYNAYEGMISSPGYPSTYPLNTECIWTLHNSPGNMITLTFYQFELQQSENCDLDYLEIREDSGIGKLISISCGTNIDPVQASTKLWIKFKSDGDDVGKGFVAEFAVVGGNELSGPTGRITSPLYPFPYQRQRSSISWRITVEFGWVIQIQITDVFIEHAYNFCYTALRVYDGYDDNAPLLLEACGSDIPSPVTTSSNVAYIKLMADYMRVGSWFDLTWLQIPRNVDDVYNADVNIKLAKCSQEVGLMSIQNHTYDFTSPGWPDGYDNNLQCSWLFTSPPGTHLVMRILVMDLEEVGDCVADYVAVYNGNALANTNETNLVQRLCLANSTSVWLKTDNVMTVKFETDGYINKTGFSAYVYRVCGGKLQGPNGVIEINNSTSATAVRSWQILCEWTVEVRLGRTIEVVIEEMNIQQGPSWTCTDNYLMLKNGGDATSPLLGVGKYCGIVSPAPLQTTGNRLYVKALGVQSNINFRLSYREVSMNCGGEFILSGKQKEWQISTPNYPNIPPPYSECTWTVLAPSKERIILHFIERFDLSYSVNCTREYVEVKDGGTDISKLIGKYCRDVAPSTMTSTGNMLFVHFYTDIPEPKNGFKALFTIADICGGIIRGTRGTISSPDYPFSYPKNQTCVWTIIAPTDHTLKFSFMDLHLPSLLRCKNTDYVQIKEKLPGNDTEFEIGTYCGSTLPEVIETASNQAIVIFKSDNYQYTTFRGVNIQFTASQEVCGGEYTTMQGTIKSNGYPNVATRSRYCDWRIKLPKGYQVVVDILDLDVILMPEPRIGYSLSFYNDFRFRSRIKIIGQNSTVEQIRSSSNTMMIGYYSSAGYRGFKFRYHASVPAPCGGVISNIKGNLTGPNVLPFNESSYFCQWSIEAPEQMLQPDDNNIGLTLSIMVTGVVGGIRGYAYTKYCYNYQYISLTGIGMICGNFSEPMYLRSPKLINELSIVNGTYGKPMHFNIEYQWQPCGGILQGLSHVVQAPKNISYPINCVWHANYPDNGEMIKLHFNRLHLGNCDKNYISIRNGGPFSPVIGTFCGNVQAYNITSTSNQLWIEYSAVEDPNDFEFVLEPANNGCGGALRGNSREISSPKFPSQYPNNAECTWEITADNGHHVGLVFVDRFNLESSPLCGKDYVEIFNWVKESNGSSTGMWKNIGKVCGRNTPPPFNSTSNRMKVIFHSDETIQGDGFRAVWNENCGGVFNVLSREQIIISPSYPNFYQPNLFCNYTLVAPGKHVIVKFMDFHLENSRKDCRFDNLTINYDDGYSMEEHVWCGENKPPIVRSYDKMEIIFRTDRYIQRTGFMFAYFLNECGGTMTEPGDINPLMNGDQYFGELHCTWKIHAPPDKNVVLRFESFELEYNYKCFYDKVEVYDGLDTVDEKRLALLCGNLTENLPIVKSNSSSMLVRFYADSSNHFRGFSAKVLFVKSVEAGCGGKINLINTESQSFKSQKGSTYESLEDCHWNVVAWKGKNIKFTINSIDVRNATNKNTTGNECTGDYIEARDGSGPFSELIGRYCGKQPPLPILSSSNTLWIRFFSDGTLEGAGVTGTIETIDAPCAYAQPIMNNTSHILTSPNYPYAYKPSIKCRWRLESYHQRNDRLRIEFSDFDLPDSELCENDYLQITDSMNRKYIEQGFGEDLVWSGAANIRDIFLPATSYKYCGNNLPHDYYSYSTEIEITFNGVTAGHRGFKLSYGSASCSRNFTAEQGRILHEGIDTCWITITAQPNHTIALYFNQFMLYEPGECTETALKVFDGDFNSGKLLATLCSLDTPSPIFSTGNKLSLHSWSEWTNSFNSYDITYTTTNNGRGCGGRLFNYAGTFTSPLYPNEYRNKIVCAWDVTVPRGLKVVLEFTVFDIGPKSSCQHNTKAVQIFDVSPSGDETLATTYCGGDEPAPFEAIGNRIIVRYTSTMNNIGTGWVASFSTRDD